MVLLEQAGEELPARGERRAAHQMIAIERMVMRRGVKGTNERVHLITQRAERGATPDPQMIKVITPLQQLRLGEQAPVKGVDLEDMGGRKRFMKVEELSCMKVTIPVNKVDHRG